MTLQIRQDRLFLFLPKVSLSIQRLRDIKYLQTSSEDPLDSFPLFIYIFIIQKKGKQCLQQTASLHFFTSLAIAVILPSF